jgi:competence protein ComGC
MAEPLQRESGQGKPRAFTRLELSAVISVLAVLVVAVLVPALQKAHQRAWRLQCVSNLKQIGLATRAWAVDHGDQMPNHLDARGGGTEHYLTAGESFLHFQVLSNYLKSPRLLVCPSDLRQPATSFGPGFSNTNLSYFLSADASDTSPQMLLCGDRNLTNGLPVTNGFLELDAQHPAGWTHEMHHLEGNVGLADGSVQGLSNSGLWRMLRNEGQGPHRLAMP